jgi:MFS family permease
VTDRRLSDGFLNLGHVLDHLFMLIYPTAVLALSAEFDRSYGELLALSLGGFIAFGAGSLPAGWLGDRWSRHAMMVVFFAGIGGASILTGLARSPFEIAAGLTLIGLFAAIYHPVGIALLVSGRDNIGRLLGINGFAGNLGVAGAALITGALVDFFNWRAAFIVPGVLSIAIAVAYARFAPRISIAAARPAGGAAAAGNGGERRIARVFTAMIVTTLCGGVIFHATTVSMPKVFDERLGALTDTTLGIGALVSMVYLFAALAQLCVGYLIDRHALKGIFVVIAALQVPLLLAGGFAADAAMLIVAGAMMFVVFGQIPINDAVVARHFDDRLRARVYAVRYVVSLGAATISVPLIAAVYDAGGGFTTLFVVLALVACATFAAALSFPGRLRATVA